MSSSRPVYVPSRKRQKKDKRGVFTGAFTGGFSAGYFNTVGSKEGWQPRNYEDDSSNDNKIETHNDSAGIEEGSSQRVQQQKMEDFMDEQDFNEWGGPTKVRQEYSETDPEPQGRQDTTNNLGNLLEVVRPIHHTVGQRLLRVLGWRNGDTSSMAYVQDDGDEAAAGAVTSDHLSKRRLKRISLQQKNSILPPPKLDNCGLGFDRYRDAPEFERHRARRQRMAQERRQQGKSNVYRLSNLIDNEDILEDDKKVEEQKVEADGAYDAYETTQDFIGSKTVGGFALRDDDDDVYDDQNHNRSSKVNTDDYDTVLHDHSGSDVEDESMASKATQEFGSTLASWASTGDAAQHSSTNRGITSDGRPPLPGFVLGGTTTSESSTRFPGPDLPINYDLKRHEFGPDEYPAAMNEPAFDRMEQRRKAAAAKRKEQLEKAHNAAKEKPMAGGAFAGLAAAMKNRFTSSSLSSDAKAGEDAAAAADSQDEAKEIKITRSVMSFVPDRLVCKRFHVTPPSHATATSSNPKQSTGEAAYFEREILNSATGQPPSSDKKKTSIHKTIPAEIEDGNTSEPIEQRPPMELLSSIFQPESAAESSSESESETEQAPAVAKQTALRSTVETKMGSLQKEQKEINEQNIPSTAATSSQSPAQVAESQAEKKKSEGPRQRKEEKKKKRRRGRSPSEASSTDRRKKKDERKKKKHRSRSPSVSDGSSAADDRNRDVRRREKKKGKKKRKSSRKRDRKDGGSS